MHGVGGGAFRGPSPAPSTEPRAQRFILRLRKPVRLYPGARIRSHHIKGARANLGDKLLFPLPKDKGTPGLRRVESRREISLWSFHCGEGSGRGLRCAVCAWPRRAGALLLSAETRRHRWAAGLKGALRGAEPSPEGLGRGKKAGGRREGKIKASPRRQAAAGPGSVRGGEDRGMAEGRESRGGQPRHQGRPMPCRSPGPPPRRRCRGCGAQWGCGGGRVGAGQGRAEELGKAWGSPRG